MAVTSNGEEFPKSRTNPVFLDVLLKIIVVPALTQKGALPLAFGMFGAAEAESPPARLISTSQGDVGEPQVLDPLQILWGFVAEHIAFRGFFLSLPSRKRVSKSGAARTQQITEEKVFILIHHLMRVR